MGTNALKVQILKNNKTEDVLGFLFAVFAFLKLSPYFLWNTFNDGVYERILGNIQTVNIIALIILFIAAWEMVRKVRVAINDFCLMEMVLVSGFIIIYVSGRDNVMSRAWINYLVLSMYLLSNDNVKNSSFRFFEYIFAITLLPAILWHVVTNLLGISISYTIIRPTNETKVAFEYTYRHYLGAVQLFGRWDTMAHFRFNGIYDEPGVVGTVAGLLLTINLLKKEKEPFIIMLLFVEGLLSLSLAFIMFLVIYFVVTNIIDGKAKGPIIIAGLVFFYIVFINIHFSNDAIASVQARLKITSTGLSGENRTSALFDTLYSQFRHSSDIMALLFGCGPDAIMTLEGKSLSYRNIIYDYGYVVFSLFISFIVLYIFTHRKKGFESKLLVLLLLILANIYQRAGLFYFPYMLILIGGVAFLQKEQTETITGSRSLIGRKKFF